MFRFIEIHYTEHSVACSKSVQYSIQVEMLKFCYHHFWHHTFWLLSLVEQKKKKQTSLLNECRYKILVT